MDSLKLYEEYRYKNFSWHSFKSKEDCCNDLIKQMYNEASQQDLGPLLAKIQEENSIICTRLNEYHSIDPAEIDACEVNVVDACLLSNIFLCALNKRESKPSIKYLFLNNHYNELATVFKSTDELAHAIIDTGNNLKGIIKLLPEYNEDNEKKKLKEKIVKLEKEILGLQKNKRISEQRVEKLEEEIKHQEREYGNTLKRKITENNSLYANNMNLQNKLNEITRSYEALTNSYKDSQALIGTLRSQKEQLQKQVEVLHNEPILESERQVTVRARERRIQFANGLLQWTENQKNFIDGLKPIQYTVQESLKLLRDFEKNLTEQYTLNFFNMLVHLYSNIESCYDSSFKSPEYRDSKSFRNIVDNYQFFMDDISDCLYNYGIEDLSSNPGTAFNGKIHQALEANGIDVRNAVVAESVHKGFKFIDNDLVLRKEEVKLASKEVLPEKDYIEADPCVKPVEKFVPDIVQDTEANCQGNGECAEPKDVVKNEENVSENKKVEKNTNYEVERDEQNIKHAAPTYVSQMGVANDQDKKITEDKHEDGQPKQQQNDDVEQHNGGQWE